MKVQVSVIIPVYNCEAFIEKCIRSVMEQTFTEFEAIIINDGSTDRSWDILSELVVGDERFFLVDQENKGVGAARNLGIELAKGKYLLFIDGDDYIGENYVKNLYNAAESNQAQMVICGFRYIDEKGKIEKEVIPGNYIRYKKEECIFQVSVVWAHLYLRQFWEKYRIRFENEERGEDMPVSLFFSVMCDKIVILAEAEYYYVQHQCSAMHNFRGLEKYHLPYHGLEKIVQKILYYGIENSPEFCELYVLRILATCYFDLSRGADRNKKRELCNYMRHMLQTYFPQYYSNRKTRNVSGLKIPLYQKIAVRCLMILVRTKLLYPVSILLC